MQKATLLGALIAVLALPGTAALSDPMMDVCHARAQKGSGFKSQGPNLSTQQGGVQMRLSGSVGLGVSRSRGAPSSNPSAPFAGAAATERREREARAKYQRLYDACLDTR